ncbi:MAG TPA: ATP-binding protein [Chryseolinea sp.]|nr:ATP-binding protein [Chryseolinea sp.]
MAKAIPEFDKRKYMQLAIDVMKDSIAEVRKDGKVSPKVGAVLVFPDGTTKAAFRGELREGDHAEYTLIERKGIGDKLDECILFGTLEPCVERNLPKKGCCRRVSNARIKTMYIGIEDPDPTVAGEGIRYLEECGITVKMFDRDLQKVIEQENDAFLKQAKDRAKHAKLKETVVTLKQPVDQTDVSSFSDEALNKFISQAKLTEYTINTPEFNKYLVEIGAMAVDEKGVGARPTGMGLLLFGKNPRARYKQAVLKASVNYGGGSIEVNDFDQALVLVPALVDEWLRKVLPTSKDTSSFQRKDVPNFPIEVLREAIVNALVHRDYAIEGARSSLEIDNDKIVVKSPGVPMASITLEQLNTFKAPSISRNAIITYVFSLMDYVEERGFGMETLKTMNEKYALPLPEYTFQEPFLTLTFARDMDSLPRVSVHHVALQQLNDEELTGYEFIKSKEVVSRKDYEEHFKFEKDAKGGSKKAERHLKKMVDLDLIKRDGSGPSTRYIVIPT